MRLLKAGAYGLLNFLAEFLRWCRMYDLYQPAIIWVCAPFFGKSKFHSPFRRKIYLPDCHATSVDFIRPTELCLLRSVPDPCYVDLLMLLVSSHNSICPRLQNPPPIHRRLAIPFLQLHLLRRCLYCAVLLLMDRWISKNIMIILRCSLRERYGECLLPWI